MSEEEQLLAECLEIDLHSRKFQLFKMSVKKSCRMIFDCDPTTSFFSEEQVIQIADGLARDYPILEEKLYRGGTLDAVQLVGERMLQTFLSVSPEPDLPQPPLDEKYHLKHVLHAYAHHIPRFEEFGCDPTTIISILAKLDSDAVQRFVDRANSGGLNIRTVGFSEDEAQGMVRDLLRGREQFLNEN